LIDTRRKDVAMQHESLVFPAFDGNSTLLFFCVDEAKN